MKNFALLITRRSPRFFILKTVIRNYVRSSTAIETNDTKIVTPTFRLASQWPDKIAITDEFGHYSYRNLFNYSRKLADELTNILNGRTQERITFICPNNAAYVLILWACWMSGQIAVPLCPSHPQEMLEYFITDSGSEVLLHTEEYQQKSDSLTKKIGVKSVLVPESMRNSAMTYLLNEPMTVDASKKACAPSLRGGANPNLYLKWNALIIYTSGSTAMPKGVVLSFANISSQINGMISAWEWSSKDTILHALPLHHVHGLVNGLLTPLQCGARCLMLPKFNAADIWKHLLAIKIGCSRRVTVFTGVPTMYIKLIEEYEKSLCKNNRMISFVKATCSQKMRLMMCGSAPLPSTIFEKWEQITGQRLLERYGMSEVGMALTNPYNGERKPGFVGNPLPNVNVRIVDNEEVLVEGNEFFSKIVSKDPSRKKNKMIGELQIKSTNVFKEYWGKADATRQSFIDGEWFLTGDTAQYVDSSYKILGRTSVDIIKSGGYKLSALFIESVLLQHSDVEDVAVIGLPDLTWGQMVVAVLVLKEKSDSLAAIKNWIKEKLPSYSVPAKWKIVTEIPRNAMGKVNKKELVKTVFPDLK